MIRELYKEANPTLTATYNGFVYLDSTKSVSKLAALTTTATTNSMVRSYLITAGLAEAKNHTYTYNAGTLTVEKANHSPIVKEAIATQTLTVPNQANINLLKCLFRSRFGCIDILNNN
jgi:hypothetical protein